MRSPLGSLTAPELQDVSDQLLPPCLLRRAPAPRWFHQKHPIESPRLVLSGGYPVSRQQTHFSVSTESRKGIFLPTRLSGRPHL